jgi:nucleotidyltransferase substrate binding protein (TIGR01987 family)
VERLTLRYNDTRRALETLREIVNEPYTTIVRDAAIQRFEYTFEALWKFLKEYLQEKEGIVCSSPKACFRETFSVGLIREEDTVLFLQMTDDRNMTSHTYKEEVARLIYGKLKGYSVLMEKLFGQLKVPFK